MHQLRFPTRNRPPWLWACLFVVVLLPLTLGQSSAGGCGATVPPQNTDPVDSDGDGYSDYDEVNFTPGTDPNDPTDNPDNVRDTDADGCSDYDELNFPNFCDNDPYTSTCQTTYYDEDFRIGFDLPENVGSPSPVVNGVVSGWLWEFLFSGYTMAVTYTVAVQPPSSLADFVIGLNETREMAGAVILDSVPFTLSDGTPAYFTSLVMPSGNSIYGVDTFANGYGYEFWTGFPGSVPTDAAHTTMFEILDSLCID